MTSYSEMRRERDDWRRKYEAAERCHLVYCSGINLCANDAVHWFFSVTDRVGHLHEFGWGKAPDLPPNGLGGVLGGDSPSVLLFWRTRRETSRHISCWEGLDALESLRKEFESDPEPNLGLIEVLKAAQKALSRLHV